MVDKVNSSSKEDKRYDFPTEQNSEDSERGQTGFSQQSSMESGADLAEYSKWSSNDWKRRIETSRAALEQEISVERELIKRYHQRLLLFGEDCTNKDLPTIDMDGITLKSIENELNEAQERVKQCRRNLEELSRYRIGGFRA